MAINKSILIIDDIPEAVAEHIRNRGYKVIFLPTYTRSQLIDAIQEVSAVIYRSFSTELDKEVLMNAKKLKVIVRTGGGMGKIDAETAQKLGIQIRNTVGCNSYTAAEFIFASFTR